MLSPQEKFDLVVRKLVEQGEPAYGAAGCDYCIVRDGRQLRCAAGWLVERPETLTPGSWNVQNVLVREYVGDVDFVRRLQYAHDDSTQSTLDGWRRRWAGRMAEVAGDFQLSTAVLDELATPEWIAGGQ